MPSRHTVHIELRGRSLLERIIYGVLALALLVLGFFFLAAAVVAGVLLAAVLLGRLWWIRRKMMKAAATRIITAEYTVVERETLSKPPTDPVRGRASNGVDADNNAAEPPRTPKENKSKS